tara:strand:+ start:428 stop:1075 length:648 start_codon:yes stop_codon:yes gene_type:complete
MKTDLIFGNSPNKIYSILKKQIISGKYPAGKELKIQKISNEFKLSIVPVREAFRMLASEELIKLRTGKSPVIKEITTNQIFEINKIRLALEPLALEDSIQYHTKDSINTCLQIIKKDQLTSDPLKKADLNNQFHMALLKPTKLKKLFDIISNQFEGITRFTHSMVIKKEFRLKAAHVEHLNIIEAIKIKNNKEAKKLLREHIKDSTNRIRSVLTK